MWNKYGSMGYTQSPGELNRVKYMAFVFLEPRYRDCLFDKKNSIWLDLNF
jgi:hypothetical protein